MAVVKGKTQHRLHMVVGKYKNAESNLESVHACLLDANSTYSIYILFKYVSTKRKHFRRSRARRYRFCVSCSKSITLRCSRRRFTRTPKGVFFAQTPPFLFAKNRFLAKKGGSECYQEKGGQCLVFFCPPAAATTQQQGSSCAAGAMSTMDEQNAASVLGIKSYVGPLGDITSNDRVDKDFNHELLAPARQELKDGLDVGRFKGQHVDLAKKLLDRIKKLRKGRRERDRVRRIIAEKKQVCLQQYSATVPWNSGRVYTTMFAQQPVQL